MSQNKVRKENADLHFSVVQHWGKWSDGMDAAGLQTRKYRYWTRESVMDAVKQRHQGGLSLKNRAILEDDPSLIVQIRRFYGTKESLYQACGIQLQGLSRDSVLEILKNQYQRPGGLHSRELRRLKIYGLMVRYFGSKTNACKAIGLSDREIRRLKRPPRKWTEETVIKAIHELRGQGKRISGGIVNKTNPGLYRAARTHFESWAAALQSAGIHCRTSKSCRRISKWNKEKILERLKSLSNRYGDDKRIPVQEKFKYYWLCRRYFGSTKEAWTAVARSGENEKP